MSIYCLISESSRLFYQLYPVVRVFAVQWAWYHASLPAVPEGGGLGYITTMDLFYGCFLQVVMMILPSSYIICYYYDVAGTGREHTLFNRLYSKCCVVPHFECVMNWMVYYLIWILCACCLHHISKVLNAPIPQGYCLGEILCCLVTNLWSFNFWKSRLVT